MQSALKLAKRYWAELLLVLAGSGAYLYKLGSYRFFDGDEMIYHQVAHNINRTGNWITLFWRFNPDGSLVPWFEKPPLIIWLKALLIRLPGQIEFWSRLPSGLAGIGTIVLTYAIAKRLYDKTVGLAAAYVALTSFGLIHVFRIGRLDGPMIFFWWLAFYFALRLKESPKFYYLLGAAIGLGALTKGPTALLIPVILALVWAWNGEIKEYLRSKHLWIAGGIAVAITAPWHFAELMQWGHQFWDSYFGFHIWKRIKDSVVDPYNSNASVGFIVNRGNSYYLEILYSRLYPWIFLLPFGFAGSIVENWRKKGPQRLLLVMTVVVFVFFSLLKTKIIHYTAPAYPALAIMVAVTVVNAFRGKRLVPILGLIAASLAALYTCPFTVSSNTALLAVIFVLSGAVAFCFLQFDSSRLKAGLVLSGAILVGVSVYPFASQYRLYTADYIQNAQPVAELSRQAKYAPPGPIVVYPTEQQTLSSFVVLTYTDRPVFEASTLADVADVTKDDQIKTAIVNDEGLSQLKPHYSVKTISRIGAYSYILLRRTH